MRFDCGGAALGTGATVKTGATVGRVGGLTMKSLVGGGADIGASASEGVLGVGSSRIPCFGEFRRCVGTLGLSFPKSWIRVEKVTGRLERAGGALTAFTACTCCCARDICPKPSTQALPRAASSKVVVVGGGAVMEGASAMLSSPSPATADDGTASSIMVSGRAEAGAG